MKKPGHNTVLVRMDPDYVTTNLGLVANDFIDTHNVKSPWGTVLAIPEHLFFFNSKDGIGVDDYGYSQMAQASAPYDVDIEIVVGDRVCLSYLSALDGEYHIGDNVYAVPYEMLYAVDRGGLYPLNGLILINRVDFYRDISGIGIRGAKYLTGVGEVISRGMLVRNYLEGGSDIKEDILGKTILFRAGTAVRIEHDLYSGSTPLYKIHQKHIIAYEC